MTALDQNILIVAGDNDVFQWTVTDNNGAAVDVTNFTVEFVMARYDGDAALVTKSGSIVDGPSGVIQVEIDAVDTSGMTEGIYRYQCRAIDAQSKPRTVALGDFTIKSRIS